MSVLVIQPDASAGLDTMLSSGGSADLNFGSGSPVSIGTRSISKAISYNRFLIRFDLGGLPALATVNSAQLLLKHLGGLIASPTPFYCRRVTQTAWVEEQATWNRYATGQAWATPGGDATTTGQDSVTLPDATQDLLFTGLSGLVNDAIANQGNQLHLLLVGPEIGASNYYLLCVSSDDSNPANRPKLTINYTPQVLVPADRMTGNMQQLVGNLGA